MSRSNKQLHNVLRDIATSHKLFTAIIISLLSVLLNTVQNIYMYFGGYHLSDTIAKYNLIFGIISIIFDGVCLFGLYSIYRFYSGKTEKHCGFRLIMLSEIVLYISVILYLILFMAADSNDGLDIGILILFLIPISIILYVPWIFIIKAIKYAQNIEKGEIIKKAPPTKCLFIIIVITCVFCIYECTGAITDIIKAILGGTTADNFSFKVTSGILSLLCELTGVTNSAIYALIILQFSTKIKNIFKDKKDRR